MDMNNSKKGIYLVLLTALISGFSIFVNSYGVKEFDSSIFTFLKNAVVAVFLAAIILFAGNFAEIKILSRKNWLRLVFIGLLGGSIPFLLFFKGLQLTTGTTSGFIQKTIFIYTAVFAIIFLKEKLTKSLFIGALFLAAGNYFMLKPSFAFSIGHVFVLIATIMWAAEYTYSKHVLKELSGTAVAFGRMFFGSIFILIFLAATGKLEKLSLLTSSHFMWIGISSLFLLLYVMSFYNGLKEIKATTAACILSLGMPITTLLGVIFAGKALTLQQSVGMLLIVAGVSLIAWFSRIASFIGSIFKVKEYGRD